MNSNDSKKIYMIGIGGIAMGTLATMLKDMGHEVTGSDQNLYPPMSDHLEALKIPVFLGYDAENPAGRPADFYIIGNVVRRENPEAQFVLQNDFPYLSMPQAIERFLLPGRQSVVVAGTHGKSTTTSLLAWVLAYAGLDPTAFIGAFVKNWRRSYRLGGGRHIVIEGDEYDTAFFDKGPKFLHYQPSIGILTSVEFDHADIFASFDAVFEAFRSFVRLIRNDGFLIANADDEHCMKLSNECSGKVFRYGRSDSADWRVLDVEYRSGEVRFKYLNPLTGTGESMVSRLPGRHNIGNTLAVIAAASIAGVDRAKIQEALLSFGGVVRRQEVIGESGGVIVMDDFAHHPTAVLETLQALRRFYPDRRIVAAFEPRTNSSRRSVFQDAYAGAFDDADCVCLKDPPGLEAIPEAERLDPQKLASEIALRVPESRFFPTTDALISFLLEYCSPGDLVVCMSNGSFDGLPRRLFKALRDRENGGT